jgi:hypothetical protein
MKDREIPSRLHDRCAGVEKVKCDGHKGGEVWGKEKTK